MGGFSFSEKKSTERPCVPHVFSHIHADAKQTECVSP